MRYLLLTLASLTALTPVFGKEAELSEETKATLGKLVAETLRPSLLFAYKAEAIQFTRGSLDQSVKAKLLKEHAGSLDLAAAHCQVIADETHDFQVWSLATRFGQLRKSQAELCGNTQAPDAVADASRFMLQSMFYGMMAKDRKEADQMVVGSAIANSINYAASHAKVEISGNQFVQGEQKFVNILESLSKRYPSLDQDPVFAKATNQMMAEHEQRGKTATSRLAADTSSFYQGLIGKRSERLDWNFEASDKFISIKVVVLKSFGACVCSDVELVVQGGRTGQTRTLKFKVVHLVNKAGFPNVIDVY
jgi:hypothetical protein